MSKRKGSNAEDATPQTGTVAPGAESPPGVTAPEGTDAPGAESPPENDNPPENDPAQIVTARVMRPHEYLGQGYTANQLVSGPQAVIDDAVKSGHLNHSPENVEYCKSALGAQCLEYGKPAPKPQPKKAK